MLSPLQTSDFANVFLQTHDHSIKAVMIILMIVGAILAAWQPYRSDDEGDDFLFGLGALLAIGGLIGVLGFDHANTQISNEISENMVRTLNPNMELNWNSI